MDSDDNWTVITQDASQPSRAIQCCLIMLAIKQKYELNVHKSHRISEGASKAPFENYALACELHNLARGTWKLCSEIGRLCMN